MEPTRDVLVQDMDPGSFFANVITTLSFLHSVLFNILPQNLFLSPLSPPHTCSIVYSVSGRTMAGCSGEPTQREDLTQPRLSCEQQYCS